MDENVKLRGHNKILKEKNQSYLDCFAMKDIKFQKDRKLNSNA